GFTKWKWIDLKQKLALADICAFCEVHFDQRTADLRFHLDGGIRLSRADRSNLNWDGFFHTLGGPDRRRWKCRRPRLGVGRRASINQENGRKYRVNFRHRTLGECSKVFPSYVKRGVFRHNVFPMQNKIVVFEITSF